MKYKIACAIIENDAGQLLLVKRGRDPFTGSWALVSGIGESKKGIAPEIGIVEEVRWDLGTDTFQGRRIFSLPIENDPLTGEVVVFVGHIDPAAKITMRPGFSLEYKWIDRDDPEAFQHLAFEHAAIIERYLNRE